MSGSKLMIQMKIRFFFIFHMIPVTKQITRHESSTHMYPL